MANKVNRGASPRRKGNVRPSSRGQYNRKKHSVNARSAKNDMIEQLMGVLIFVIAVSCIVAVVLMFKVLNADFDGGKPSETKGPLPEETVAQTQQNIPDVPVETQPEGNVQPPVTEQVPTQPQSPADAVSFVADLSEYEKYMNPTGAARDEYLILVNPKNPLPANYVPKGLVDVKSTRKDGRKTQQLREYAAKALEALMLEAQACGVLKTQTPSGYPLSVMSAYRTYEYQGSLFEGYVNNEMSKQGISRAEAEAIVVTYSCRAGTSEHQAGLSVDMHTLSAANVAFKNEAESAWLLANCHKFGFILRFPEDKTAITEIQYEPWHFRYVGRYHATQMKNLGMCLEEYTEYLKNNG